jgi:hypothetical protein
MATYPQHTTIIPDDDFEADLSLSNEDGSGLDNDDCDMDLDIGLNISGRSSDLDDIQLIHTLLNNSAAINSNGMDYMVLSDLNRSSFDMESMLIDLLQQQQQLVQPAENDGLNRICLLKKIKERYNPCCSNRHHSRLPGSVYSQHQVCSVSDDLESNVDLALTRFTSQPDMISHQCTPRKSTPVALNSTMATSRRLRRRNAICHHF